MGAWWLCAVAAAAVVVMSRCLLASLPHSALTPSAPSPSPRPQTKNAHRRLQASLLDGRHLEPADGGPAELQDVLRVFISLAACEQREADLFRPLMQAALALLPDIQAGAAAPPTPEAAAAAAAQSEWAAGGAEVHLGAQGAC